MTPDSARYSDPSYDPCPMPVDSSYREPAKPIYCAECGDVRVEAKRDVCTFCTICAVRGPAAAEAWWMEQHWKGATA